MNVVVINFSGNVGKSTVARHLLAPRMNNAPIIPIESINSDGTDDEALRGRQFGDLIEGIVTLDNAVVDVGASNVEDFLNQMQLYRGSHEDFDYFVVPVVPKVKQIRDTISTITALGKEVGIPAKKIRLLFNMVEIGDDPQDVFSGLFDFHSHEKLFTLKPEAIVHASELFAKVGNDNILDILADQTDLKAELKAAKDAEEKVAISRKIAVKRLAAGVSEELDHAYKALFGK